MKHFVPLVFAVAAFFIARQFRPAAPAAAAPEAAPEAAPAASASASASTSRDEARGMERRARKLAELEAGTPAALERLRRSGNHSTADLLEAVKQSAEADPEGTWQWIDEQDFGGERQAFREAVALIWFPRDPEAVLSRLGPTDSDNWRIAGSFFSLLASKDPASVAAVRKHLDEIVAMAGPSPDSWRLPFPDEGGGKILLSLPPGPSRDLLTRHFANEWLNHDFTAAQAWMTNLSPVQRDQVMAEFSTRAIHRQGEAGAAAAGWIMNEAPPALKAKLGPSLVEWLAKDDPATAFAWATSNLSAGPLATATGNLVSRLFADDPELARQTVEDLPPGNLRHQAALKVAEAWAAEDPQAAVDWWLGAVDPAEAAKPGFATAAYQLGQKWLKSDPDSIRARFSDPDSSGLPVTLAKPALREWMKLQPDATLDWVETLPADRRPAFAELAFRELSWQDPIAAARLFDQRPETAPPAAAGSIASSWFGKDPEAAIAWAAELPKGESRAAALRALKGKADFEVQLGGRFPPALQKLLD